MTKGTHMDTPTIRSKINNITILKLKQREKKRKIAYNLSIVFV